MMDFYCEQLVAKARTASDTLKIVISIAVSALVALVCVVLVFITGWLLLLLLGFGAVGVGLWLASNVGVEYEYIITNNEMDIDKIIGKRRRIRMITVDLKYTTDFLPLSRDNEDYDVVVWASVGVSEVSDNVFCLFVEHSGYGRVKIVFNPNKKVRSAIAMSVPKELCEKVVDNNG